MSARYLDKIYTWEPEILLIDGDQILISFLKMQIYTFFEMHFSGVFNFYFCSVSHCSNKPTIEIIDKIS